jgi:hypothetical protein
MAIVELSAFDLMTATPHQVVGNAPFWVSLPRITKGEAVARVLMVADTLKLRDVMRGYDAVSTPRGTLPQGIEAYRYQYEDYLRRSIKDVRFLRSYLAVSTTLTEDSFLRFLGTHGIGAQPLAESVPRPFSRGEGGWKYIKEEDEESYWGLLVSKDQQPGSIYPTSLHRFFGLEMSLWASLQVYTYSAAEAARLFRLKDAASDFDQGATKESKQGADDVSEALANIRREMNQTGSAFHTMRFATLVHGHTPEELETNLEVVSGTLPFQVWRETAPGEKAMEYFGDSTYSSLDGTPITTSGVAVLMGSVLSYRRRTETRGVMLGFDRTQAPVIFNIFDDNAPSYNTVVLGQTGAGKTFAVLLFMMRHLLLGVKLIIVDPQGNIDLSFLGEDVYHHAVVGTKGSSVNVLDIVHDELSAQIDSVLSMMGMLGIIKPSNEKERAVMDYVLNDIYQPLWAYRYEIALSEMPMLENVQSRLRDFADESDQPHAMKETAKELAFRMSSYTPGGSRYEVYGKRTSVNFSLDHQVTVFDISQLPKSEGAKNAGGNLRAASLAILVADINQAIRRRRREGDRTPILFFLDEMGVLMRDAVIASHVSAEYKTARARLVGMIVADQDLESLLGSADETGLHHGIPMLANAATTFIFRQKDSERSRVVENFPGLPMNMVDMLPALPVGTCVGMFPSDLLMINVTPGRFDSIVLSSRMQDKAYAKAVVEQMKREVFGNRKN